MAERSLAVLGYRIRRRVVVKYVSMLSFSLAAMVTVPSLVALAAGDLAFAWRGGIVVALLAGFGLAHRRTTASTRLQANEAFAITTLTFVIGALVMTWPLMTAGLGFIDALFEAVSGITTTGLSTVAVIEDHARPFVFCRSWMQWYGGLAIIVMAIALIVRPGNVSRRLAGDTPYENLVTGTQLRARQMLIIYGALTLVAIATLWLLGAGVFDAVVHGLSSISTGGFSSHSDSIASLPHPAQAAITFFSLLGAISFSLQYRGWPMKWRTLLFDREVQTLFALCILMMFLLFLTMSLEGGVARESFERAAVLAVSAQTTTGYSNTEVSNLDAGSKLVMIVAMMIGGDMGSTAGGIKIFRLLVILRLLQLLFARTATPSHAVMHAQVGGRTVAPEDVQAAVTIVMLYVGITLLSWFAFLLAGHDSLDSLFEVVSALGTVGLSTGLTGPALAPALKLVLCADMLMGRLEILAVLVLFYPVTWRGGRSQT